MLVWRKVSGSGCSEKLVEVVAQLINLCLWFMLMLMPLS